MSSNTQQVTFHKRQLVGAVLAAIVLLVAFGGVARTARADSVSSNSGRRTVHGWQIDLIILPVRADWYVSGALTYTNYGSYHLATYYTAIVRTVVDYGGYDGHLGAGGSHQIKNGYGEVRVAFGPSFGFGCVMPWPYASYACGTQSIYAWLNPGPGILSVVGQMTFYGGGWATLSGGSWSQTYIFN